jgi:hypothetical protein
MGRQADLCWMLNAPSELECPFCNRTFSTYFDDYDIDSPCNPEPGVWKLRTQCPHCDEEGRMVRAEVELRVKPDETTVHWSPVPVGSVNNFR